MQVIELPNLAHRSLQRFVDQQAEARAQAAVKAARPAGGVLADACRAAREILAGRDDSARERFRDAVTSRELLALLPQWIRELREIASLFPDSGACTVASALKLWSWTLTNIRAVAPQAVDELTDALVPLFAARWLAFDVTTKDALDRDLCAVYGARAAAAAGTTCAELVFGYRRHLTWDAEGCATCYDSEQLDELEAIMPGIASGARTSSDVLGAGGSHPAKRGPCANANGVETFVRLRSRLDACLSGSRIARDRAAAALASEAVR